MAFTNTNPTKQRILEMLADGLPHTKAELMTCFEDDMAPVSSLFTHISSLRKDLRPIGQDIICEYIRRRTHYRHVRLLASPYDGS